jgi:hypothetical protein
LTVRQVTVPAAARRLATLERIDYADAFVVQIRDARKRTAEQWARVVLEEAPVATRNPPVGVARARPAARSRPI